MGRRPFGEFRRWRIYLSAGALISANEIESTIVLERLGTVVAAGQEMAFKVKRKGPNDSRFSDVGRATYDVDEEILKRLTASFSIGEDNDLFYELSLEKQ